MTRRAVGATTNTGVAARSKLPPDIVTLTMAEPTPTLNQWQRMHWAKRKRVIERFAWLLSAANKNECAPMGKCTLTIDRYMPGAPPDWDNLYGGVKPLIDCLVVYSKSHPYGLGYIVDDNPACVVSLAVNAIDTRRSDKRALTVVTIKKCFMVET